MIEEYLNRVICADCMDILPKLPDKSVDLLLVDPPYGIKADSSPIKGKFTHTNYNFDTERPPIKVFKEMLRVSKHQIIWGGGLFYRLLVPFNGVACVG